MCYNGTKTTFHQTYCLMSNTRAFLILPKLNYIEHVSSVTILVPTISLALRSKDNKQVTVEELYKDQRFEYHLIFFDAEHRDIWQKPQKDKMFEVSGLSPNTEYNGSVYIMIGDKQKSEIQNFAVKTLPDHSLATLIVSLITIFVAVLGTAMLYLSCKYVRRQAKTPSSLDFKKFSRIPLLTKRKENCSTMGFSQWILPLTNYSDLNICQYQGEDAKQIGYARQSHTSDTNTNSQLLSKACFDLQQNNKKTDLSVQYGGFFEDTMECQNNPTPDRLNNTSYNSQSQSEFHVTFHQLPLDKDSGPLNRPEDNGLPNHKPNHDLNLTSGLMSSVVVSNAWEFGNQGECTETFPPLSLLDLILPGFPNGHVEENASENRLPELSSSHYRMQLPVEDSQLSFTNATSISEQPYRLQR
ncbi:interleukin-22 receptor subunit alpha-1 isoform X2 [Rana temporaria]|uniref:interleukin-22 receptor subunit alpha-1 isoform X2 n=1 Tax=Rana temporaria TaxID=8407 RepID=UPI001AAD660C|nr:interleukin-22 receptor subunit alpha-1 isoform X2 [Rana temporaria]